MGGSKRLSVKEIEALQCGAVGVEFLQGLEVCLYVLLVVPNVYHTVYVLNICA
jgi:hypothetical protein